jgi:hypothetical protein
MSEALLVGLLGLIGGLVSSIISYRQGGLRVAQDLQIEYDKDLRQRRIQSYTTLWQSLRLLAKYPEPETLTHVQLKWLGHRLREWYFDGGGMVLSDKAREAYFDLQDGIKIILQKQQGFWDTTLLSDQYTADQKLKEHLGRSSSRSLPDALWSIAYADISPQENTVHDNTAAYLRALGSSLRTILSEDVMSRVSTLLLKKQKQWL